MKRGIEDKSTDKPTGGATENVVLELLLEQVNKGNYDSFKLYLKLQNKSSLKLHRVFPDNFNFSHLTSALKDMGITFLDVSYNNFGPNRTAGLVEALKGSTITALDYSGNKIGLNGIKILAKGLQETDLTFLKLSRIRGSSKWVPELVNLLKNSKVSHLDISYTDLDWVGAQDLAAALRGSPITHLNLEGIMPNILPLYNVVPETALQHIKGPNGSLLPWDTLALNRQPLEKSKLTSHDAYYIQYLPLKSKQKFYPKSSLILSEKSNPNKEIAFALGIFMNLPQDLQKRILCLLPLMSLQYVNTCQKLALEYYNKKGIQEYEENEDTKKCVLQLK